VNKTTESFPPREAELRATFLEQVASFPEGHKIKNCLQCGTCTGTCPVSYAMDLTPRQMIALFRAGHMEEVLRSRAIWLCASCYACTVRCPAGIRVTDTLYALKRTAMKRGIYPRRFPVHALSRSFTRTVRRFGRNYELELALRYFARSDVVKLFTQSGKALKLMRRGRLPLLPSRIKRIDEVRAIIARAEQFSEA
jgi:heterodisulfide reductase subunit C